MLEIRVGGRRFRTTLVAAPRSLVSKMVAPDLATADAATYGSAMLDSFKIDISHQEMERIIIELELIYKTQPGQWLPISVRAAAVAFRPPTPRLEGVRASACGDEACETRVALASPSSPPPSESPRARSRPRATSAVGIVHHLSERARRTYVNVERVEMNAFSRLRLTLFPLFP
jgi:hypothetical protein